MLTKLATKKLKLLIADDDPAILDLFRQTLLSEEDSPSLSFDLVTCRQGEDAVDAVKQSLEKSRPFSAAFIDIRMPPGPDGIWTAEQIRRLDKNVEILIMTGYSDAHPRDITRRIPPVHKLLYVQKPIHIQEIYQFASALSMKWRAECELQKLNRNLEQCVEERVKEFKIINNELQVKIDELQKAQSALQESESRYRAIAENSRVGFWQTTLDGHTLYINPAMCEMLEIDDPEALEGKTYHSFYSDEDQKIIKRELAQRQKRIGSTYEVDILGQKGGRRNVMVSGAPIFLTEDKIHSTIGTFADITDKKRAEKELLKAHKELENRVETRTSELRNAIETIKQNEKQLIHRKLSLEKVNKELLETNQAVSVLARHMDKKKEELKKKIFKICKGKMLPILNRLQNDVYCQKRQADLELVMKYIYDLTHDLSPDQQIDAHLTEQEMRVAVMIKNGLTSQQIADLLCISLHTVKTHRKNIRKKLKISHSNINLVSYLKSELNKGQLEEGNLS